MIPSIAIATLTALLLAGNVARAAVVIVPVGPLEPLPWGYGGYGGYVALPEHVVANQQYYDLSLGGIERLCAGQPDLCAAPAQQATLARLQGRRRDGLILIGTGVGAAVAGTIWSTVALYDADAAPIWRLPMAIGLLAGVALPIAGSVLMPSRGDAVDFVNQANAAHPDAAMQIQLGGVGPRAAPGVTLSYLY